MPAFRSGSFLDRVARSLPDAATLVSELESYRVKMPKNPSDPVVEWRERPHDDLVFALALAAWVGERALATI
jgi:hypothetical protein